MYDAMFQRLKSTDFPQACLGMYYFAKGRTRSKYFYRVFANGLAFGQDNHDIALLPAKFCPMCGKEL